MKKKTKKQIELHNRKLLNALFWGNPKPFKNLLPADVVEADGADTKLEEFETEAGNFGPDDAHNVWLSITMMMDAVVTEFAESFRVKALAMGIADEVLIDEFINKIVRPKGVPY